MTNTNGSSAVEGFDDPDAATGCADDNICDYCEGCGAPLYADDSFVVDENGVSGCWAVMSDPPVEGRPCYADRVGKDDANLALTNQQKRDGE